MKPPVETGITAFARNDVGHEKVPIDGTRTKDCMDLIQITASLYTQVRMTKLPYGPYTELAHWYE